uniref:very short patch repair endonuclease n=1 Tax=Candidatus Electronema sp. TJ TaxID=3401573 RepID=UPI003AA890C3
ALIPIGIAPVPIGIRAKQAYSAALAASILPAQAAGKQNNSAELPDSPDIVLPKYRIAIFVHGCFWHRHENCAKARMPGSNQDYWQQKFARNMARDAAAVKELEILQWRVLVLWECEILRDPLAACASVISRLQGDAPQKYAAELDRRQILQLAEKKNRCYLNRKRQDDVL